MSNIFGYISRSGAPVREGLAGDMMQALADWKPDRTGLFEQPGIVLGSLLLHTTPESLGETLPYTDPASGLTITADARIDNRDELSLLLGLTDNVQTSDSIYILYAYRKWGYNCCQHLLGDYTFAVWDSRKRELFCARDHIGARGLFYYEDNDRFIFATEPKGILATGEAPTQLSESWKSNILVDVYPAKNQAPFEQMKKLPPAHHLLVTSGSIRLQQYWDLDITREIRYRREQDYYDHMRALLEQAVRRCTRSAFAVGAELSGGLDSSGIAAFAQAQLKQRGEELNVFSHALPDWAIGKIFPFDDEKQFIESLCKHANITQQHYIYAEGKGILDEFRLCTERFGYPTGYPLPIFCDALYEKAQTEGVRVLLSGFPGDELVTSHGAEFYNELLHRRRYVAAWRELYRRTSNPLKAAYALAIKVLVHDAPGLYRLLRRNTETETNWRDNSFACCVTTDEYAGKMRLRERLFDTTTYPVFNNVRAREKVRITETFVCHRMEQSAAHALYHGIEYRNPFADRNLLEYVLALPPEIKVRDGMKRYPYRMAIKDMVPEDVRWRTSKMGATIPTVSLRILKDSGRMDELLHRAASSGETFPPYIDIAKMKYIKQRLDNKQLKDAIYSHSFYAALMLKNCLDYQHRPAQHS